MIKTVKINSNFIRDSVINQYLDSSKTFPTKHNQPSHRAKGAIKGEGWARVGTVLLMKNIYVESLFSFYEFFFLHVESPFPLYGGICHVRVSFFSCFFNIFFTSKLAFFGLLLLQRLLWRPYTGQFYQLGMSGPIWLTHL